MPETPPPRLAQTLQGLARRAASQAGRDLGESNTKATLIEPLLEALGWDTQDTDVVHREFRARAGDNPVDYALRIGGTARLFIEAKALGEDLTDRRWAGQLLGYAGVAGIGWCVLTDGDEYRFYNAAVSLDADQKLFARVKLSETDPARFPGLLSLLSRSAVEQDLLSAAWTRSHANAQLQRTLGVMIAEADGDLLRLLQRRIPSVDRRALVAALQRIQLHIPADHAVSESAAGPATSRGPTPNSPATTAPPASTAGGSALGDLIAAGILRTPLALTGRCGDREARATLLADGRVEFNGRAYDSPSAAAKAAFQALTDRAQAVNGWVFWRYTDPATGPRTLDEARARLPGGES